ncbi:hypothetical protein KP509_20G001300 [Ceratopteris richardii]|uniref:Uncharacterized protein n=1 Tax=Ceratopteris richardii TaxID=49495 RepID=A0A8T2SFF5_CERRI|nr:hypothetical protein KP509_20G001300 [Ceratopteris richardii]
MMGTMIWCSSRSFAVGAYDHSPACRSYRHALKLPALSVNALRRLQGCSRVIGFTIRATSSDFGDPERYTGEDYYSESRYGYVGTLSGDSDSEGESLSYSHGSLSAKLDATSQFSESVPSSSVEQLEEGGGDNGDSGTRSGDGGSGGSNDGGNSDGGNEEDKNKKKLSASQKLTLAYAALIAAGGAVGYVKSKSVKSLASGGISAAILYYVYTQLPTNPTFASSLGLGVSALLLAVMGSRFKKSGKLFPAGIVSIISLIMTGGYIHGIIRSAHA